MKVKELKTKDEKALKEELAKLKEELSKAKLSKVSATSQVKASKIGYLRKSIARVLTFINMKRKALSAKKYLTKKHKPLDMRPKKTRALRRKMTKYEKSRKPARTIKRLGANPMRKFAIKHD